MSLKICEVKWIRDETLSPSTIGLKPFFGRIKSFHKVYVFCEGHKNLEKYVLRSFSSIKEKWMIFSNSKLCNLQDFFPEIQVKSS